MTIVKMTKNAMYWQEMESQGPPDLLEALWPEFSCWTMVSGNFENRSAL